MEAPKTFTCNECGSSFLKKSQLDAHWSNIHSSNVKSGFTASMCASKSLLKCALCHIHVESKDIMKHYADEHQIPELERYASFSFDNEDSFNEWKKSVEKNSVCKYIKAYSSSKKSTKFICHRSGEFKTAGKGIHSIKTKGSKKIVTFC